MNHVCRGRDSHYLIITSVSTPFELHEFLYLLDPLGNRVVQLQSFNPLVGLSILVLLSTTIHGPYRCAHVEGF